MENSAKAEGFKGFFNFAYRFFNSVYFTVPNKKTYYFVQQQDCIA